MIADRRRFLRATGTAFAALAASGCTRTALASAPAGIGYGALVPDPQALVDLPRYLLGIRQAGIARGNLLPRHGDGVL